MTDLTRTLDHARIDELPNPYFGKVRDCYDLPDDRRILISSDRISAFDRILTSIPFKGQVLTQTARFWFDNTSDICPNHVLDYPDPNVVIGKHLTILPVEIVVRGYLAGSTGTSVLTLYKKGEREMYGHRFPDGLRDNQALPAPIITPHLQGIRRRPRCPADRPRDRNPRSADPGAMGPDQRHRPETLCPRSGNGGEKRADPRGHKI
ncbi:hypothetical protein Sulfitobl28_29480 [Sulfitobacter pontiacus]|nr:hypothetical protein Sulfitobl28_29480 [Sulfitobacter pontiacus]